MNPTASAVARMSGAKMADLPGQMLNAAAVRPDYLTVLIGGFPAARLGDQSMHGTPIAPGPGCPTR